MRPLATPRFGVAFSGRSMAVRTGNRSGPQERSDRAPPASEHSCSGYPDLVSDVHSTNGELALRPMRTGDRLGREDSNLRLEDPDSGERFPLRFSSIRRESEGQRVSQTLINGNQPITSTNSQSPPSTPNQAINRLREHCRG